jgi:predicted transposase/invertase (TIGR01784 family)
MKNLNPWENPLEKSNDDSANVNRNYKDSMFTFLFSNPDTLRELYSAIEGIAIPPEIPIDINTLSGVLFITHINDLSFLIDNRLVVLIEHQSTLNNNIPFRLLEYIARIYEKITNPGEKYQKNIKKIPRPEFIVLYNGEDKCPDYSELKLSDMFMDVEGLKPTGTDKIPLELIAQVYNINHGHNPEILKRCETLDNYSIFIDKLRERRKKENSLDKAFDYAIEYCKKNNILKKFFEEHSSEVRNMIFGEYDRELDIAVNRREAWEEGMENEKLIIAKNLLSKGSTPEFVHEITGLSLEKIKEVNL